MAKERLAGGETAARICWPTERKRSEERFSRMIPTSTQKTRHSKRSNGKQEANERNRFNILWAFIIKEFVKNPELHEIFIGIILLYKNLHVNMVGLGARLLSEAEATRRRRS
jgi:hypothetical protein